jgi:hypothetical protein
MDTEYNIGLMELIMKVNGVLIKLKVKELFGTLREMFTEENSKMIWLTVMENTHISMDQNIKGSLKMTFKKDTEKKNGLMELSTLVHIKME